MKQIERLPHVEEKEVTSAVPSVHLRCCPITLNPTVPNIRGHVKEYDSESGGLCAETTVRAYGPILFDGKEVVEVHRTRIVGGKTWKEIHWAGVTAGRIRCTLRACGGEAVEQVMSEFPVELSAEYANTREIRYFRGLYEGREFFSDRVAGWVDLTISGCSMRCIKLIVTGSGREIHTYISVDTGYVQRLDVYENGKRIGCRLVEWNDMSFADPDGVEFILKDDFHAMR
ncbi:hypothetical protein JXA80_03340 [bacterium]|nr:hypothetical protein [candidate division CSSED10-310 bacterium]